MSAAEISEGIEDWEKKADADEIETLEPLKESTEKGKLRAFCETATTAVATTKKSDEISSFNDILRPRNEFQTPESKARKRPETTSVVARRMLSHALQRPDLINRKEESELRERRTENRKTREQRRKDLDSVWE